MSAATSNGPLEHALTELLDGLRWFDGGRLAVEDETLDLRGDGPEAVRALGRVLYADWYARVRGSALTDPGDDVAEALRAEHAGAASFEPGWRTERVSSAGRVLAGRDGETRLLHPVDYVCAERPGLPPPPDGALLAVARRDSPQPVDGYWMTWGPRWPPVGEPPLVRVYWNVPVEAAPVLVGALTAGLGPLPLPWMLKLPVDARQHARADAAVLYLPRAGFAEAAPALRGVADAVRDRLVHDVPPLALPLTAGVGLAEDPGGEESFGTSRCRLIAEAIAGAAGSPPAALMAAVRARFLAAGLDPERPHLEPGSTAEYAWERVTATPPPAPASPTRLPLGASPSAPAPRDGFLSAAATVAGRLADEAIWSGDLCTWVGDALEPTDGAWSVVLRACDGDVYAGTAGIAWFLARSDDDGARAAAAGGARHALRWATRPEPAGGLHEGSLGAALAVLDVANLLGDGELRDEAAALAAHALRAAIEQPSLMPDLLAGEAGSVIAALALERVLGAESPSSGLVAARVAGERLLAGARHTSAGWWWDAPGARAPTGLCGLAHGGAGIALALAALHRRTGDGRFAEGAREALRWERRWFSRATGGWPDLRGELREQAGGAVGYPALWCHGAVGIGLSRLLIHAWTGECSPLAEAGAAIQATRAATSATLAALAEGTPGEDANWSICHGLSGSAELLLTAWETLGHPDHLAAARRIGAAALHDGGDGAGPWRCGVPQGGEETPGLMLGLAGIGMTLLRLHDPWRAPSPALFGLPSGRATPASSAARALRRGRRSRAR